jgi:hypothetical protein
MSETAIYPFVNEWSTQRQAALKKFQTGNVIFTTEALRRLPTEDVYHALARHRAGDWGDIATDGARRNDRALIDGKRICSVYQVHIATEFWIITEWDRSSTTICLTNNQ